MTEPRGRLAALIDPEHPAAIALKTQGFAIVEICSKERAAELAGEVWADIEALGTGVDRNKPSTWKNENWMQTTHHLCQNQQMGLRTGACLARLVTEPFWRELFGGRRVVSSFDAVTVARPDSQERTFKAELVNQKKLGEPKLVASWLHTDQAKGKPQCMEHIQMAFALTPLGEAEQRTQIVAPRAGESLQSFRDRFIHAFPPQPVAKGKWDAEREEWIKHTPEERNWLLENGRVLTPTLEAGQAILWDSGEAHASLPGEVAAGQKRGVRVSTFVSALPLSDEEDLKVRRTMLENGDTSGHRVTAKGAKKGYRQCKFAKTGQTWGKKLPNFSSERVVSGFKRAFEEGDEDSVAFKVAKFCGGY